MEIGRYLAKDMNIADIDKAVFNKWAERCITTGQALRDFTKNNSIYEEINPEEFVAWLHSLGYRRL